MRKNWLSWFSHLAPDLGLLWEWIQFKIRPKSPDKQTSIKPAAAFKFHFLFPSNYLKKRISMKRSFSKRTLRFAEECPEMAKNAGI